MNQYLPLIKFSGGAFFEVTKQREFPVSMIKGHTTALKKPHK